jgi:hypothetical protein
VHMRVLPDFKGLSEFWGFHDACGPDALLMNLHCLSGYRLDGPAVDALRQDMLRRGLFAPGGTTMRKIAQEARDLGYRVDDSLAGWSLSHVDAIHEALKQHAGCVDGDGAMHGVVLQVNAAHNLIGNEPSVMSHFVAVGGMDASAGYLIGNGDDVNALNSHNGHGKIIPCRWMGWDVLASAQPTALLVVFGKDSAMLPYTQLPDGRLKYNAGTLGAGFSELVLKEGRTSDLIFPDFYYNSNECCCAFYDGTVYYYDARTNKSENGKAGYVVQGLHDALRAATDGAKSLNQQIADARSALQP